MPSCKYSELFRYANGTDKCLMTIGAIAASLNGFSMPLFAYVFGEMTDSFG